MYGFPEPHWGVRRSLEAPDNRNQVKNIIEETRPTDENLASFITKQKTISDENISLLDGANGGLI